MLSPSTPTIRCYLPLHQEGLDACRETLNKWEVLGPQTENIVQMTTIILRKNTFSFNGLQYLQKQGTAMGTRTAPSYTNGKA